eukprot:m.142734 g.142734  ORF g.142734 m.142734 type:complete len:347 (-) comp11590_c4_seq1:759-1799(-)
MDGQPRFSQGVMSQFRDFVLRSQRYQPLALQAPTTTTTTMPRRPGVPQARGLPRRHLTLVEEIPGAALRDPAAFHAVLELAAATTTSPLVIVASTRSDDGRILGKVFPKQVLTRLGIVEVKFNAVAPTALGKALRRVAETERRDVTPQAMDQIVEASGGDLRCAINSLQVLCLQGVPKLPVASGAQRKRKRPASKLSSSTYATGGPAGAAPDVLGGVGARYLPLDMFHALGRVLHAKRNLGTSDAHLLPPRFAHHGRHPSAVKGTPESAFESSNMPPDLFALFLHENYLPLFSKLSDLEVRCLALMYLFSWLAIVPSITSNPDPNVTCSVEVSDLGDCAHAMGLPH